MSESSTVFWRTVYFIYYIFLIVDERAPRRSTFLQQSIPAITQMEVDITYFETPSNFYVKTPTDSATFTALMKEMQQDYVRKLGILSSASTEVPKLITFLLIHPYLFSIRKNYIEFKPASLTTNFVDQ